MIIFPAVDIQAGRAVRLRQGRKDDYDVFAEDPVAMALQWQEQGARWLHIVDLDGAFDGRTINLPLVRRMAKNLKIPFQVGGGIRTVESARHYMDAGAQRLIIGTAALEDRDSFAKICATFPGKIGVSLDARNGVLKSRGWLRDTGLQIREILPWLAENGVAFIIYTDIERDGMKAGVNIPALLDLLHNSPCPVIAAGGIADMNDVRKLANLAEPGLEGFISGRALYEKSLNLPETLAFLKNYKAN